jgi:hypothetical protein
VHQSLASRGQAPWPNAARPAPLVFYRSACQLGWPYRRGARPTPDALHAGQLEGQDLCVVGRCACCERGGYHRRSRVETMMNCVKLLGQRLAATDF